MKSRRWLVSLVIVVVFSMAMTGCLAYRRPVPNTPANPQPAPDTPNPAVPMPSPAPNPNLTPGANDRSVAERVQRAVNEVPDVTKSYVVVVGNTALIGVDINESKRGPVDEELKQRIAQKAEAQEKSITTVYVTADPNLVTRVRRLADSITEGKPISGLLNEIMEILQKLKPTGSR